MKTSFIVSVVFFALSLFMFCIGIIAANGFTDAVFDSSRDSQPFIEQIRTIIRTCDALDVLELFIVIASGISMAIISKRQQI